MSIRENTPVKVIDGFYKGKTGKVVAVFPEVGVATVSFDDTGDIGKVSPDKLVEILPQEIPVEIPEGAKKISRDDFDAALDKITDPDRLTDIDSFMTSFIMVTTAKVLGVSIGEKIFKDADVVVMTEGDFIRALWDGCSPSEVVNSTNGRFPVNKTPNICVSGFIGLEPIIRILFGESENG